MRTNKQDREASAADSESVSEDGESVPGESTSESDTPEAEVTALITSERALSSTSSGSSQCEVSLDPEGMVSPGEGLDNVSTAASTSLGPDKRYTALSAGETKRLAGYIPEPPRFSLRGRTRGEERRLSTDAQGMVSLEDELEIELSMEKEAMLEEAYMVDAGVSFEMPAGNIQDLPPPPATQAELL